VSIYSNLASVGQPEIFVGSHHFQRTFTGVMAAMIRHSANWMNKLDREFVAGGTPGHNSYGGGVWRQEHEEWGVVTDGRPEVRKVFLSTPSPLNVSEFISRLTTPRAPATVGHLTTRVLFNALDVALIQANVTGQFRERAIDQFSHSLKESVRGN